MRDLLLDSLEPDTIKWGHGLASCRAIDKEKYELTFLDSAIPPVTTSLVVGADGTYSRVRPLLHTVRPTYTGVTMFDLSIPSANMTPALHKFVGLGSSLILEEGTVVLPQMNSKGKCRVYLGMKVSEAWLDENPLPDAGRREWLDGFVSGWCGGQVRDLIMASEEEHIASRRIFAYDPKFRWKSDKSGVTVMGEFYFVSHGACQRTGADTD